MSGRHLPEIARPDGGSGWFSEEMHLFGGRAANLDGTHDRGESGTRAQDGLAGQAGLFDSAQRLSDTLGVTPADDAPAGSPLASIQGEQAYGDGDPATTEVIRYAFGSGRFREGGRIHHGLPWSAEKMAQFALALASWEAVANIRFVEVSDPADADIVEYLLDSSDLGKYTLGYHYEPFDGPSIGAYNVDYWNRSGGNVGDPGGYFFTTLVHEIGHALGLGHPHDRSLGTTVMDGVSEAFGDYGTANLNQGIYTTMSYNKGYEQVDGWLPSDATFAGTKGPGALDIAAIQNLYGANTAHAAGNDVYHLPDANVAGTGYEAIWDTGGTDWIAYSGSRNVVINLRNASLDYTVAGGGIPSSAAGVKGGFTIAAGVVIENIRAGSGDDRLFGNAEDNIIRAGAGADRVFGFAGNDVLFGYHGRDVLKGGPGNDVLAGNPGNDVLIGEAGGDTIIGGGGNDSLLGGPGGDRFAFQANGGKDVVRDFEDGIDRLDFRRVAAVHSIDDLVIREFGHGTVIAFGDDRVVLPGVDAAVLDASDFLF